MPHPKITAATSQAACEPDVDPHVRGAVNQTYHIEALSPDRDGKPVQVVQRATVRSGDQDAVERRAVRLLQRSQLPQWNLGPVEIVRIVDGAGNEIFRWSLWEELATPQRR